MKSIFTLSALFFAMLAVNAQPCTPGAYTTPGIYPDTTINLPQGAVTQSYQGVITAVVPSDTTIYGIPATIDSIGVTEIQGLPTGFTWAGSRPSNFILGGTTGCIGINGTPTAGQEGTYPLLIKILSSGKLAGMPTTLPDTLNGYKIVILDQTHVSIVDSRQFSFGVSEMYPNPASTHVTIVVTNNKSSIVNVAIKDMLGRQVALSSHQVIAGENKLNINVSSLNEGVYFYTVSDGVQTISRKLIIER